jgi:hypothetical protein
MQEGAVRIQSFASGEDLEIAYKMTDDKAEQDDTRYGHDRLLTDRRLVEPEGTVQVAIDCDRTHLDTLMVAKVWWGLYQFWGWIPIRYR